MKVGREFPAHLFLIPINRMPALHYFNPGHETAVLNGSPYYMPPGNVLTMQNDLSFLPAWYASPGDYVLVKQTPSPAFINETATISGQSPAIPITEEEIIHKQLPLPALEATPWGISPQSLHVFEELQIKSGYDITVPEWDDSLTRLCGRQTAALCLRSLIQVLPEPDKSILPRFRQSIHEIEEIIQSTTTPLLIKAPYSSSGRGLLWLTGNELSRPEKQWISGILKKQGAVSIERVLNKKQDFAMEFYSDGKGNISYEGLSFFSTAEQGAYTGNFLGSQKVIKNKITALIHDELLDEVSNTLTYLLKEIYGYQYRGYLGIDMMVYENPRGILCLHPCVEINMRYTMGVVAIFLSKRLLAPDAQGYFLINYYNKQNEAQALHRERQLAHPIKLNDKKIESGYFSLCPIFNDTKYTATIHLTESR